MDDIIIQEVTLTPDQFIDLMDKLEQLEILVDAVNNLSHGIYFIMVCISAFLIWKVVTILYKLFGGVFFGGI